MATGLSELKRIAELERKIGQLTMENDFLKKPRRRNLWVFDTFERRLEAQVAQTTGKRYAVDRG